MSTHLNLTTTTQKCYVFFADDTLPTVNRLLLLSTFIVLFLSICTTNIWMIVSLWKNNVKFLLWQKLLFFLCLIDSWSGFITIPVQIYMVTEGSNATCLELAIQGFSNALTPMMSCVMMSLIAAVRYFNITHNETFKNYSTNIVIVLLLVACILSVAVALWHSFNTLSYNLRNQGIFYVVVGLLLLIFLITSVVMNVQLSKYIQMVSSDKVLNKSKRDQQRVSKTILLMSSSSILIYFPSGIVWLTSGVYLMITNKDSIYIRFLIPWLHTLSVANSGINSLIYLVRTRPRTTRTRTFTTPRLRETINISINAINLENVK